MKIVFPYTHLDPGGIERAAVALANGFARRGASVEVALLRSGGQYASRLLPEVRLIDLKHPKRSRNLLLPGSPLVRYLKESSPDVVVSLGHSMNETLGAIRWLYKLPVPMLFTEHSTLRRRIGNPGSLQWWRRSVRARFLYRQCDLCAGVSRGVVDDLVELGVVPREKTRVIYNPVFGADLPGQASEPVDHPWLQTGQPPVLLGVGRFVETKGFDDLLRAVAALRAKGVEARLVLLGEGEERPGLERLTRELGLDSCVEFAGLVANPYAWMSKAALLVSASRLEGFGNAIAEALACGCNVVATDCPSGPREILEDGKWGRLVPVGDIDVLADAIQEALLYPLPAETLRQSASRFREERSIEEYYRALCGIVQK